MLQRKDLTRIVESEIRSANRGRMPTTGPQVERIAAHFGCQVEYHPRPFGPENCALVDGTIHVPIIEPGRPLHRCYIHELAEAALQWEGRAPIVAHEPEPPPKHEIARAVDLLEPRKCLTQHLHRQIMRQGGQLGTSIAAAGFDVATLTIAPDGAVTIRLAYSEETSERGK